MRETALFNASQKAAEFRQECEAFEGKYGLSFAEFEKRIHSQSEEGFAEHDDYLAWKFAQEGTEYWRDKIQKLRLES
jgi:hypothetical protein